MQHTSNCVTGMQHSSTQNGHHVTGPARRVWRQCAAPWPGWLPQTPPAAQQPALPARPPDRMTSLQHHVLRLLTLMGATYVPSPDAASASLVV